jgi:hypothetical protein
MRLVIARCEVHYTGRLAAVRPEAVRLLVFKADGAVLVHDDAGGYKPLNCIRKEFRPERSIRRVGNVGFAGLWIASAARGRSGRR